MKLFSAKENAFYDSEINAGGIPADAIEITDELWMAMINGRVGKILSSDENGMPTVIDPPPPTLEQLITAADAQKQRLLVQANEYMNSKQWPGKAAIGRLKTDELAQYNLWLDYLDALEAIDTSTAPDIEWPVSPE